MADELGGGHKLLRHENSSSTVPCRLRKASASQAFSIDPELVARGRIEVVSLRGSARYGRPA